MFLLMLLENEDFPKGTEIQFWHVVSDKVRPLKKLSLGD